MNMHLHKNLQGSAAGSQPPSSQQYHHQTLQSSSQASQHQQHHPPSSSLSYSHNLQQAAASALSQHAPANAVKNLKGLSPQIGTSQKAHKNAEVTQSAAAQHRPQNYASKHVISEHGNLNTSMSATNGNGVHPYTVLQGKDSKSKKQQYHSSADAQYHNNSNSVEGPSSSGGGQGPITISKIQSSSNTTQQRTSSSRHQQQQNHSDTRQQYHVQFIDDNLHCESIEEEVIQAVRGGGSGVVVSVSGKINNSLTAPTTTAQEEYQRATSQGQTSLSEERKRIHKNKAGSIIISSQAANQIIHHEGSSSGGSFPMNSKIVNYHSTGAVVVGNKQPKKTTASQNKFDIKAIVAAGQEGCYSRRQASRDRSNPTSSSGFQTISNQNSMGHSQQQQKLKGTEGTSSHERKANGKSASHGGQAAVVSGSGGLFSSFFSQPQEHYEYLTKTLGCTPQSGIQNQQNQQVQILHAPGTGKQTQKKGMTLIEAPNSQLNTGNFRKSDQLLTKLQASNAGSKQASNRVSTNAMKTINGVGQTQSQFYKSFQTNPQHVRGNTLLGGVAQSSSNKISNNSGTNRLIGSQIVSGSAAISNNGSSSLLQTLHNFTQSYYGAQHEKNKKRQPHQAAAKSNKLSQNLTMAHHPQQSLSVGKRGDIVQPELEMLKNQISNQQQQIRITQPNEASSRQLKFGQIMEELERFSLSNNNCISGGFQMQGGLITNEAGGAPPLIATGEEWALGTGEQQFTAHSSICESDLEFTNQGNIRASTYKRTQENQAARQIKKRAKKQHRSEERKKEPSFFTDEYMQNRYINDRVEMELQDFKTEIEKKFESSKLRDFKFPLIEPKPKRQVKSLAPNQPHLYQEIQRGHSVEEENQQNQNVQRITLGDKNLIYKTTTSIQGINQKPSSSSQATKGKVSNILDEQMFPLEITKTQDLRQQQANNSLLHNDSLNEETVQIGINQTQDSIIFMDGKPKVSKVTAINKNQPNVLLQNFIKQSFDNRPGANKGNQLVGILSTKKSSNLKTMNVSHNDSNFHTFDASMVGKHPEANKNVSQQRNPSNTVIIQKINPAEIMNQSAPNESQLLQKEASNENQMKKFIKNTPKNYSLQLNQVVKKILNDSTGQGDQVAPASLVVGGGKQALNSASFDQMMYEPSFYTTESYNQHHGGGTQMSHKHHNNSLMQQQRQQQQQMYFTKDYLQQKGRNPSSTLESASNAPPIVKKSQNVSGIIVGGDCENDQLMQSYTNTSEHKKLHTRTATSTKKQLKVKRSDSNGSQQKNTLLNKIYRSSKTIKSPQSRQSNMNLNNQNPLQHQAVLQVRQGGGGSDAVRFVKPSQTVNQSNINSTLSSVRQFQVVQTKPQPLSQSRQGSSGIRVGAVKSTQKCSRIPSTSNKKHHQHTGSHAPSIGNFQTDTGASFHNYPQSISNRGAACVTIGGTITSTKSKKQQILIKSSQIKRTSGERSGRDSHVIKYKLSSGGGGAAGAKDQSLNKQTLQTQLLIDSASQFGLMQRSFHKNPNAAVSLGSGAPTAPSQSIGPATNLLVLTNQNTTAALNSQNVAGSLRGNLKTGGSVASSPDQHRAKNKSASLTSKNTQRGGSGAALHNIAESTQQTKDRGGISGMQVRSVNNHSGQ